jgi:hypothetical protein
MQGPCLRFHLSALKTARPGSGTLIGSRNRDQP